MNVFEPVPLPSGQFKVLRLPNDGNTGYVVIVCKGATPDTYVSEPVPLSDIASRGAVFDTLDRAQNIAAMVNHASHYPQVVAILRRQR